MVIKKEKESLKIKDPFYGGKNKRKKWIQDNAPCHCSLDTRYFIKKSHNIFTGYRFTVCPPGGANLITKYNPNSKLKPYPPDSPDFNPCEYLFIIYQLKNEVYYNYKRSKDYNITSLRNCIENAWEELPDERLLGAFQKVWSKYARFYRK